MDATKMSLLACARLKYGQGLILMSAFEFVHAIFRSLWAKNIIIGKLRETIWELFVNYYCFLTVSAIMKSKIGTGRSSLHKYIMYFKCHGSHIMWLFFCIPLTIESATDIGVRTGKNSFCRMLLPL